MYFMSCVIASSSLDVLGPDFETVAQVMLATRIYRFRTDCSLQLTAFVRET